MEDLSNTCKGLTGGSSMAAGNTISGLSNGTGAPGSESEQVMVTLATPNAVVGNSDLDVPALSNVRPLVNAHGTKAGD
jgi:hypothetical protein